MNDLPAVREAEIVPASINREPPIALPSRASLARNMTRAQQACRAVPKDAYNTFHRYKYASAEALIEEGKAALSSAGVALIPVEQSLNGYSKEGEGRFELIRKFLLIDSSGECLPIQSAWPVVPEKGRPLDKATAIASTLSLAYLLRDLLLMPRVDPSDDLAGQASEPPATPAKTAAGPAPGQTAPPTPMPEEVKTITEEQTDTIVKKLIAFEMDPDEFLKRYAVPVIKKIPTLHLLDALAFLDRAGEKIISDKQVKEVGALVDRAEISEDDFKARLQAAYGTADLFQLNRARAANLIGRLTATLKPTA